MTTDERSAAKARVNDTLARVDFLLENEHVKWFFKEVIAPRVQKERDAALDIRRSPDIRDTAAQRHDAIKEIEVWLKEQRSSLENQLKTLDS